MEELKVGDIIKERYEIVKFLGSGSLGEVWLARDRMTGREVIVKIYQSLDPSEIEEFLREYSNMKDLSSPYLLIPEYYDVFHHRPFLVMKYYERRSSSKLSGNISEEQLWAFIEDVANGLDVLHNQSVPIVHQDIKPDNILIDNNGRFLLTNFGISKQLRATMHHQSKRDVSSGAMPYMAPEGFNSDPKLSTASDIWSLGASIYELATGELPFSGYGGAMQRSGAEMPRLPQCYSEELNTLMQQCLSLDAEIRPTSTDIIRFASSNAATNLGLVDKLTDFEIEKPEDNIQLNLKGHITEVIITPRFNDNFGTVWFFVVSMGYLGMSNLSILHDDTLYNNSLRALLMVVSLIGPVVMWLRGYYLVKRWNVIGKYLMCGAIYNIIFFTLWGCCVVIYPDLNLNDFFAKTHWRDYCWPIIPIIIGLGCVSMLIGVFWGLFSALRSIKKLGKENPVIWSNSGNKLIPITLEYILPILFIVVFTVFWVI